MAALVSKMNSSRKLLIWVTSTIILIGIILSLSPFVLSLKPNPKSQQEILEIDLSEIGEYESKIFVVKPSKVVEIGTATHLYPGSGYLVVRGNVEKFYSYWVATWKGSALLPESHWGQHGFNCKDFSPNLVGGEISNQSIISCNDINTPPWGAVQWQWDMGGSNQSGKSPGLKKIKKKIVNQKLVLYVH